MIKPKRLFRIETMLGGGLHCDHTGLASWLDKSDTGPVDVADILSLNYNLGDLSRPNYWARPMPGRDGITIDPKKLAREKYLFAYESIGAMTAWFEGLEPHQILNVGAAIRVVTVKRCIRGGKQVIYRPRDVLNEILVVHGGLHQLLKQHR